MTTNSHDKLKIIRDPIYGDITIESNIFKKFIDTAQFQRLHNIKQTNLQVLFPSATHTRFEHSIGVFHVGKSIFDSICSKQDDPHKEQLQSHKYRNTVLFACLLHDIGHAPFSHIGEAFYSADKNKEQFEKVTPIKITGKPPANHEIMSCLVANKVFRQQLDDFNVDWEFFCRLITGINYQNENMDSETKIKNALINILSGLLDADKIDYIMRDAQSAGVNVIIDISRVVKSFNIVNIAGDYHYVVEKSGFSVANSIISNRNHLFSWIYGHHKVQYHYELIKRYFKMLKKSYRNEFDKLFSLEAITGTVVNINIPDETNPTVACYTDDNDLISLMKLTKHLLSEPEYKLLYSHTFERNHYKAKWKTKVEFDLYKKQGDAWTEVRKKRIFALADNPENGIENEVIKISNKTLNKGDFMIFRRSPNLLYPDSSPGEPLFYLPELSKKLYKYDEIFNKSNATPDNDKDYMLYVFTKRADNDNHCIENKVIKILENL